MRGLRGMLCMLVLAGIVVVSGSLTACSPPRTVVTAAVDAVDGESGTIRGYLLEWVTASSKQDGAFSSQELVVLADGTLYYLESPRSPWRRAAAARTAPGVRLGTESPAERKDREDAMAAAGRAVSAMYPLLASAEPRVFAYLIHVETKGGGASDVLASPDGGQVIEGVVLKPWPQ